jgi:hypothetical protein
VANETPSVMAATLAGMAQIARDVSAEARRERYDFGRLTRMECHLLYKMLMTVGCKDDRDDVLAALVEDMVRRGYQGARRRKVASARRRES